MFNSSDEEDKEANDSDCDGLDCHFQGIKVDGILDQDSEDLRLEKLMLKNPNGLIEENKEEEDEANYLDSRKVAEH